MNTTSSDLGLALLRIVPGILLFVYHGARKFSALYAYLFHGQEWKFISSVSGMGFPAPAFFAICSALAESIITGLFIAGLFTRYAAAILAINMFVAVYRHLTTDFRYELAALYAVVALAFVFLPPGRFSLDAIWRHKR